MARDDAEETTRELHEAAAERAALRYRQEHPELFPDPYGSYHVTVGPDGRQIVRQVRPGESAPAATNPLGATPPVPGATYSGASADGRMIIWTMPDGSRRFTDVSGQRDMVTGHPVAGAIPPSAGAPSAPPPRPAGTATGAAASRTDAQRPSGVTIGDDEDYRAAASQALHNLGVVNADPYITDDIIDRLALSKADTRSIIQTFRALPSAQVSGITLGQELDYRQAAQSTLSGLGVFREATADEIRRFAQGRADPAAIARHYRDTEAGPLGIGLGAEQDYRALAKRTLEQLGVTRDPTATEITAFAKGNLDAEGIQRAYATSPEVRALNPGAQYGLSREEYQRERSEVERAAASTSGLPESGATSAESEPGYLREAFTERMAPGEIEAGLEDVQRRLGSRPTAEDVKRIRTRQKVKTAEDRAGPAGRRTALGPTVDLEGPPRQFVGPRRR